MKKLIFALVLMIGFVFIITNITEVQSIADTLRQGEMRYIFISVVLIFIWILTIAVSYWIVYRGVGLEEKYERIVVLSSASFFVNVIAPSVGVGGLAVFIAEGRRRGYSTARVTVASVLVVLFDYLGFLCVLALGLVVLIRRNNLGTSELVASAILLIIAFIYIMLLFLGLKSGDSLGRVLARAAHYINRLLWPLLHRQYLSESRAHEFAQEASSGLALLRQKPINLILPLILGLFSKIILAAILLCMFLAFNVPFSAGTIVAGFSIGYLFVIVSPTPAGIGVVEGALTLGLSSLGLSLGAATVIALAYRGVTFWIPLLLGMFSFRWLSRTEKIEAEVPGS